MLSLMACSSVVSKYLTATGLYLIEPDDLLSLDGGKIWTVFLSVFSFTLSVCIQAQ